MDKKLLLQDEGKTRKVKEISMMRDAQRLKMMLGKLSWRILTLLSEKEMYPLEIARKLGMHEQKVYYHVRKLERAVLISSMSFLLRLSTMSDNVLLALR